MTGRSVSIQVAFTQAYSPTWSRQFTLSGAPNSSLARAIDRAVGKSPNRLYSLHVRDELGDDLVLIDNKVTLDQVSSLFGSRLLEVDNAGLGGGISIPFLCDVLAELAKGLDTVRTISHAIENIRWREHRAAAKEWDDRGELPRTLVDLILEEPEWVVGVYDIAFQMPRKQGRQVLRDLGYDRRYDPGVGETWWRRYPDREPPSVPALPP